MNFLCEHSIVIPRLPCLYSMAKAVSSTVVLVNWETSDSMNSFNCAMYTIASKCFPVELVPCSDGWRRTWWHMIHMMPGLPVSTILAMQIESPRMRVSKTIPIHMVLRAPIQRSPPSIKYDLQIMLAQITNKDISSFGCYHNLEQQGIWTLGLWNGGRCSKAGSFQLKDCQMLPYGKVECWFLNIDSRATLKTIVRPVRYCMHSCEVEYKDMLKRLTVRNSVLVWCKAVHCSEASRAPHELLPHRWRICLSSSGIVTSNVAHKGCQYFDYGLIPMHHHWIMQVAGPKIVDAALTLMCRTCLWCCRENFCPERQPIVR